MENNRKSLDKEFERTKRLYNEFLRWIVFCQMDEARNPNYYSNHLFSVLYQDYIESLTATPTLIKQGILNPTIRESRFLLEMSIKMSYIQQNDYSISIEQKLEKYKKNINTSNISQINNILFPLLKEDTTEEFKINCKRYYGYSSNYIHLTTKQFTTRKASLDNGIHIGFETPEMLIELNDFLEKIYSLSIVLIMNSVPEYVVGDWLVEGDGSTTKWLYTCSRYIAEIDSYFDYKVERKRDIKKIIEDRLKNVRYFN